MRAALTALIVGLAVGCAEFARFAPVPPAIVGNSATLALPLDVVWERTMRVLATQKPVVKNAHPADFFITTSKATVRLNETQADCGTYSGSPYLRDGRTLTEVAYSVYLQRDGHRTRILVNAEIEVSTESSYDAFEAALKAGKYDIANAGPLLCHALSSLYEPAARLFRAGLPAHFPLHAQPPAGPSQPCQAAGGRDQDALRHRREPVSVARERQGRARQLPGDGARDRAARAEDEGPRALSRAPAGVARALSARYERPLPTPRRRIR